VRNDRVFGRPVFIRGNFGVELRLGNNPESLGLWTGRLHPTQNPRELDRYRQMGEVAYVRAALHEATAFIESHPSAFLANTLRRVYWFWCGSTRDGLDPIPLARNFGYASSFALTLVGLGMLVRSRRPEASLFLGLLSLFPLVYYLTFTTTRYRHPIEPEMQLLMVYALTTCSRTSSAPRRQSLFVSPSLR
jgi:hypothetical protein